MINNEEKHQKTVKKQLIQDYSKNFIVSRSMNQGNISNRFSFS